MTKAKGPQNISELIDEVELDFLEVPARTMIDNIKAILDKHEGKYTNIRFVVYYGYCTKCDYEGGVATSLRIYGTRPETPQEQDRRLKREKKDEERKKKRADELKAHKLEQAEKQQEAELEMLKMLKEKYEKDY